PHGDRNAGAIYLVYADPAHHAGAPFLPNWPVVYPSPYFLPLVGEGITISPAIADVDGDGVDELSIVGNAFPTGIIARGEQPAHPTRPDPLGDLRHLSVLATGNVGELSNLHA